MPDTAPATPEIPTGAAPRSEQGRSGAEEAWWRGRFFAHRPPWWPEGEDWPPHGRRHWKNVRRHNPFLRRIGCLWVLALLFGVSLLIGLAESALAALTASHFTVLPFASLTPAGRILIVVGIAALIYGAINLRRLSGPLDALLEASNRIAEGDFSARVAENGPAEVRSLVRSFNSMAARLQDQDEQRRHWLADVTHELRTPLTILQGNLEGVVDGIYAADKPRLKSLLDEVQVLSRLTDDLRILALAEGGNLHLRTEPTDLAALIGEIAEATRAQADAAGISLKTELDRAAGIVEIDPERIRQVLNNLLFNSLRYTPAGKSVTVRLSKMTEGNAARVQVTVEDEGPGIAAEDVPHVFDRYYKTSDSRGMGLGLAIAKHIVEAHGGEISLSSLPGKGTQTTFSLPA